MRRIAVAACLVVGMGAGGAFAAPCTVSPAPPIYAFDDSAITLIFDSFLTTVASPGTCTVALPAHNNLPNSADVFELYSADVRGLVVSDPADTATITVTTNAQTVSNTFGDGANPVASYFVAKDANGQLTQSVNVTIANAVDPNTAEVSTDSIDYALFASTSRNNVNLSLNQVNLAAVGVVTHLDGISGLLTGGTLSLEGDNEVGIFGAVGSYNFGTQARFNLASGFSLLGGLSIFDFTSTNAAVRGFGGALAVRYLDPNGGDMRLFAEGGIDANALSALSFTRTYAYTQGVTAMSATANGTGTGNTFGGYGKGGVVWTVDSSNEVVLSATVKQSMLGISSYTETFNAATNPFPANLSGTSAMFTTLKTGADWTTSVAPDLDLTASIGVGTTFANGGTTATVLGGGAATGAAQSTIFADYGVRLDYGPAANFGLNAFAHGTTGTGIGTHLQVGGGARLKF